MNAKKTLLTLVMAMLAVAAAWSAKVMPGVFSNTQSDGSVLKVQGFGDENFCWYRTTDGILLWHEGTDFFYATLDSEGNMASSGILAHEQANRSEAETAVAVKADEATISKAGKAARARKKETVQPVSRTVFPHTGSPKVLVVLADFADRKFAYDDETTRDIFEQYLNADGKPAVGIDAIDKTQRLSTNYGSVRKYFSDMSYGKFTPDFRIAGIVHLGQNMKYYGEGDSDRMDRFVPDVCKAIDGDVDFSEYDENGDGYVDLIYIIYAGYSQSLYGNSTDCIWPKCGTGSYGTFDGKHICHYGVNNELNGTPSDGILMNGIGLFCHEFSHAIGLPDMYAGNWGDGSNNGGMEFFSLMDGGEYTQNGYRPTAYTAWERETMGWLEITDLTEAGTYSMATLANETTAKAYRIRNTQDENGREYYVLENIQREGWNYYLTQSSANPVHGMMITHVCLNSDVVSPFNALNYTKGKPQMTVLPANGTLYSSYGNGDVWGTMPQNLFPGKNNVTEFKYALSGYTNPIVYNGTVAYMAENCPILNIKDDTDAKMVTFTYIEDETTEVNGIKGVGASPYAGSFYTVGGTYAGSDYDRLPKGIYVINGRKIVK